MEKALRNKLYIGIFVLPAMLVFAVTFFLPICQTAYSSFFKWNGINGMKFLFLNNYIKAFTGDPVFWRSVTNTLIVVILAVLIQLPLAFIFAYILNKGIRGASLFRKLYFIPVVLSTTVISILWTKVYDLNYGLLNGLLASVGLGSLQKEWLAEPNYVLVCVTISAIWQFLGYHMLILFAGLKSIPETYYEAALIDGANEFKTISKITLPLLSNILKVDLVLAVTGSLKMFDNVFIMTKGGPYNSSNTLALLMYNEAFLKMNYGYGSALAVLLVLECLLVSFVINKLIAKENLEY